jgi:hypothetical protein
MESNKPKLMWLVRSAIRTLYYSYQTEKVYALWIKRFIHYFDLKHPKEMVYREVNA